MLMPEVSTSPYGECPRYCPVNALMTPETRKYGVLRWSLSGGPDRGAIESHCNGSIRDSYRGVAGIALGARLGTSAPSGPAA